MIGGGGSWPVRDEPSPKLSIAQQAGPYRARDRAQGAIVGWDRDRRSAAGAIAA
jgi:hypothetical protein